MEIIIAISVMVSFIIIALAVHVAGERADKFWKHAALIVAMTIVGAYVTYNLACLLVSWYNGPLK